MIQEKRASYIACPFWKEGNMKELLLKNGILIDKVNGYHQVKKDILVVDSVIKKIADNIDSETAEVFDVSNKYVSAGFIDAHIHNRLMGESNSFETVDHIGVWRGATSVIECGSVAVNEIDNFIQDVQNEETRHYGLLSCLGEEGFTGKGASRDVEKMFTEHYKTAIDKTNGLIVGLKVTASNSHTGDQGYALVKKAKEIAVDVNLPLVVHVGNFPPDPNGIIEFMEAGDLITHAYHGKEISLFEVNGAPKKSIERARRRGVYFDVGHGSASFSWIVCDKAIRQGFYPDVISTDIRKSNVNGPAHSIAVVMSKILALGMKLEDVVLANTYNCAKIFKLEGLGELREGAIADFTVFTVDDVNLEFIDPCYQYQKIDKLISTKYTVVSRNNESKIFECKEEYPFVYQEKEN